LAIRDLGYRPNRIARGLKNRASQHILFVGNDIRNSFFSLLAFEMETYAREVGYSLALAHAHKKGNDVMESVSGFYDGLIVFSDRIPIEQLNQAAAVGIPSVFAGNRVYEGLDPRITTVDIGVVDGMKSLVHHLASRGHTRIGFIPGASVGSVSSDNFRMVGYREGLQEADLEYDQRLVRFVGSDSPGALGETCCEMIASDPSPTAIICGNDAMAMRAIRALHDAGIHVPNDVAVTGFGNFPDSASFIPSITTVGVPVDELGRRVVDAVVGAIKGESIPHIRLNRTLHMRESA
jgi:LacI family transcriptional regulator